MKRLLIKIGTGALGGLLLVGVFTAGAVASDSPIFVAGNPSCTDLGYDFGWKPQPEPPPSGTYTFPDGIHTATITSNGTYFDWTSTLGVDAVIVKGGPNANVYVYDPPAESFGDTALRSPTNPSNGMPYAISHIEFCYDYEVDVTKTAQTTYTRTFNWTIDKSVTPATWDLFTGDTGTSKYTVAVTKTGYTDSDWAVNGTITVANDTPYAATITGVSDVVSPSIEAVVTCPVTFPHALASGGTLTCSYTTSLPNGTNRTNTATVTTSGTVGGNTATVPVTFGAPTTTVNGSINVDDTNGSSWGFGDTGSVTYERTFSCAGDAGTHDNTATIRETGQSDDASVTVTCRALTVTKDAHESLTRSWTWTIDKRADQANLTLADGQLFTVNYAVEATAASTDSNWSVAGEIVISNPHPTRAAQLTGVSDLVSPAIAATVTCPALAVPAGGQLTCTYAASLPDAATRTNTATATLQNYVFAVDGTVTSGGTTDFDGNATVDFGDATVHEIDECIEVSDTNLGTLGTACASTSPTTFSYSLSFGKHPDADVELVCGANTHVNTAAFVANDTGATGDDAWTVSANVACDLGCTLTPGYWKTHSSYGPAPYDDAWAMLANGADSPFFLSGQTYYQVLWTAPQGNAYYILAHAYIASQLNFLNGASAPQSVQDAFDEATTLLTTYTPAQVAALKGKAGSDLRAQFISLAGILDGYNNGLTGPGHCSE